MKLQFLNPLYEYPGTVASVYLDTSRDIDELDRAIGLRRRNLRDSLRAHDADQAAVDAIADGVGTDREVAGRHGQAIFAAHGRLFLAEVLPEPPVHDIARYRMLPARRRSPSSTPVSRTGLTGVLGSWAVRLAPGAPHSAAPADARAAQRPVATRAGRVGVIAAAREPGLPGGYAAGAHR